MLNQAAVTGVSGLRPLLKVVCSALLAAICTPAQTSPAEPLSIQVGFEQRVRNENWNNIIDYSNAIDDEREQIRYRTRLWANVPLNPNITVNVGLVQETNQIFGRANHFDEVIFETANIEFRKLFGQRLSLKVGRQNIMKGEGFIFLEGEPGDGSRAIYYNAAVLGWEFKKSKLEAIGIDDPARDRMLPRIHDQKKNLQDWSEQGLGLYYTSDDLKKTHIESYYFHKKEFHDIVAPTSAQFQPDRWVDTIGGRVVHKFNPRWTATGEFAKQWGRQHPGRDISAWGGYGYVKRTFQPKMKPYVQAGYWAMSGDDPTTSKIEGWDPIFSRWPEWSELYVYSQLREYAIAYWTNIRMPQVEAGFRPIPRLLCRTTYYNMNAYHPFPGNQAIFAGGKNRGTCSRRTPR